MRGKLIAGLVIAGVAAILAIWGLFRDIGEESRLEGQRTAAELRTFLEPHVIAMAPAGEGPFPTVALLPGCAGTKRNHYIWAQDLRAAGYGTVIVDGFAARGIYADRSVPAAARCRLLPVAERTGDVIVGLDMIRDIAWVDADRLYMIGWSQGGATIMATLSALSSEGVTPELLDIPDRGLDGLGGIAMFYPPCGFGADSWNPGPPVLFLLAEEDGTVSAEGCIALGQSLREAGHDVHVEVFGGADHGFDDEKWEGRWNEASYLDSRDMLLDYVAENWTAEPRP